MKTILFISALVFCTLVNAQETPVNPTQKDTSSVYRILLNDKTPLTGKIIERNNETVTLYDVSIGKVTISLSKVASITKYTGILNCILTTNDGKTFSGVLLSQDENKVVLLTDNIGEITIQNNKIKDLRIVEKEQIVNGQYFFANPHPTKYFFGPSAIPLNKGEGYFQNAWILANSVQIGLTDNFSMGGGMVVPFLFFFTPKIGFKVGENVHVGGGIIFASTLSSEMSFGVGAAYGSVTLGNYENNITVNMGWGGVKTETYDYYGNSSDTEWDFSGRPMFVVGGMTRIARKFALITENWIFSTKDTKYSSYGGTPSTTWPYHAILSGGFRFLGEKNSFDFGLAVPAIGEGIIGIPYLDYVFKF